MEGVERDAVVPNDQKQDAHEPHYLAGESGTQSPVAMTTDSEAGMGRHDSKNGQGSESMSPAHVEDDGDSWWKWFHEKITKLSRTSLGQEPSSVHLLKIVFFLMLLTSISATGMVALALCICKLMDAYVSCSAPTKIWTA
jgi:hypothetical protein